MTSAVSYPGRSRPVLLFAGGLVLCLALLVLLGYVVGHGSDIGLGAFIESVLSAATGKVTATVFAIALLAAAAVCVRRLWLEWLAWRPGQVVIPVFTEGSKLTSANPVHLTALFRQRFASLRLQSPAPVPGAAPEANFLEVLGQKNRDGGDPLTSLLALVQAAKPTHAYVVYGVLVERPEQPRYGVTIQVVRQPEEGAPPETVWDIDWERAIRRAADRAMAHILPRTRRCDAPWTSWRGFVMPTALLESYEAAASSEQQRRYDQALAHYFDAIERDPMNLSLRLHIGHLQEKLGLYIDALATYEGMIAVGSSARGKSQRNLYRPAARRERDRVLLLGRYRRIVLLGGPPLALQWRHTSPLEEWTERDDQRVDLRARLRGPLSMRLQPTVKAHGLQGYAGAKGLDLEALLREPDRPYLNADDPVLNQLRRILVRHTLDELTGLQRDLRKLRRPRGDAPLALTNTSLELTRICTTERCSWIERQLTDPLRWIWGEPEVERIIEDVERAGAGAPRLRWHEHYNAACALALPLLVDDDSAPEDRNRLAEAAVGHLERATGCVDSGYIATRRDWLLSEDPDLDGLRVHPSFKAFEAMYFPAAAPTPRRPRNVQRLEVSQYSRDLLDATARRWQTEWHLRRARQAGEAEHELQGSDQMQRPHELIQWWQDEAIAWRLVGRMAWNLRRWRVRYDLLEAIDVLSVKYGGTPLEVAFRTANAPWMCASTERQVDELATKAIDGATEQLRHLARALCATSPVDGDFRVKGIDGWINKLRDKDADGDLVRSDDVARLCDRHAAVWESVHLWLLDDGSAAASPAAERFDEQLRKLTSQLDAAS